MAVTRPPEPAAGPIYEGARIPPPVPTELQVDPSLHEEGDILEINFGPNHPSTHGVLRLVVELNGERVVGLDAVVGYLHTGFEKNMEAKTYWKGITYAPRMDYVAFQANELRLRPGDREAARDRRPPKAVVDAHAPLRAEPDPLAPGLPRHGRARAGGDLDVLVLLPRARRDPRPVRDGRRVAHAHALLPGRRPRRGHPGRLLRRVPASSATSCPSASTSTRRSSRGQPIFLERTKGIGLLSADDAIALGQSGPVLRASGVDWDLRAASPTSPTTRSTSTSRLPDGRRLRPLQRADQRDARVGAHHPAVPRRDARRAVDLGQPQGRPPAAARAAHVDGEPDPPLQAGDRGLPRPEGEVYVAVESPRGEFGCYLVSDGGPRPWRVKFRAPSFVGARGGGDRDDRRADRRPDRDRRLARHRHGRGRPVSARTLLRRDPRGARRRRAVEPLGRHAGAPPGAGASRLAAPRGDPRGRGRARPDARLLRVGRELLRHVPPRAGRPARGRGLHQRLVRAGRRPGRARGLRARARHPRGRDDRGRRVHAHHLRVPRRLRLGGRRGGRLALPRAREGRGRAGIVAELRGEGRRRAEGGRLPPKGLRHVLFGTRTSAT